MLKFFHRIGAANCHIPTQIKKADNRYTANTCKKAYRAKKHKPSGHATEDIQPLICLNGKLANCTADKTLPTETIFTCTGILQRERQTCPFPRCVHRCGRTVLFSPPSMATFNATTPHCSSTFAWDGKIFPK